MMDKSCEKPIRRVSLNKDALIVSVKDCGTCKECKEKQNEIEIVNVEESDKQIKMAYTRWLEQRERFITQVITLDWMDIYKKTDLE